MFNLLLKKGTKMKKDQTKFEEEIIKNFGNYEVTESQKNWNSYSKFQKHWLHIEDPANFFKDVQFAFKERN